MNALYANSTCLRVILCFICKVHCAGRPGGGGAHVVANVVLISSATLLGPYQHSVLFSSVCIMQ